jgi:hypothetical protein
MNAPPSKAFVWSDAWLLLSLIYARGLADRATISEYGDFINHAIFTRKELEGGLSRLVRSGLVRKKGKTFAASARTKRWYVEATGGRQHTQVRKDLERVEGFLEVKSGG